MPPLQSITTRSKLERTHQHSRPEKQRHRQENWSRRRRRIRNQGDMKMELIVKNEKENGLLGRKEVTGTLAFSERTPSNKEVTEALSKKFNVPTEQVTVKHIYGSFGGITGTFDARIYSSKEQMKKIEPKTRRASPSTPQSN